MYLNIHHVCQVPPQKVKNVSYLTICPIKMYTFCDCLVEAGQCQVQHICPGLSERLERRAGFSPQNRAALPVFLILQMKK